MKSKLWALVQATAGNENSMAKDIRMKRRTESDYLAGIALQQEGFPTDHAHPTVVQDTFPQAACESGFH